MLNFEWDENKDKSNKLKHTVSFNLAKETFEDEKAVEFQGKKNGELRIIGIGKTFGRVILSVVYTMRLMTIRIISARSASKSETRTYLEENLPKQSDDES